MGNTKFTLIELHLDGDTQFGLGALDTALPFGTTEESTETTEYETETEDEADEDGSGGKAIGAIVALVLLVAAGVAAKKFRGDDEPELEEEEQPDVIVN
ncbi:hypothetical protein [Natronorubrum sp. DTA7]|uniref:hypothetical protein n=1 Tax=Natronorubrum sp. DTA7 TaxID=3447016 RepID=UPI003F861A5C